MSVLLEQIRHPGEKIVAREKMFVVRNPRLGYVSITSPVTLCANIQLQIVSRSVAVIPTLTGLWAVLGCEVNP